MLSIQMCPLVPCAKKPSITTWGRERRAGRGGADRKKTKNRNGGEGRREDEKLIRRLRFFRVALRRRSSRVSFLFLFHERVNDVPVSSTSAPGAAHFELLPKWNLQPPTSLSLPGDVNASLSAAANNDDDG